LISIVILLNFIIREKLNDAFTYFVKPVWFSNTTFRLTFRTHLKSQMRWTESFRLDEYNKKNECLKLPKCLALLVCAVIRWALPDFCSWPAYFSQNKPIEFFFYSKICFLVWPASLFDFLLKNIFFLFWFVFQLNFHSSFLSNKLVFLLQTNFELVSIKSWQAKHINFFCLAPFLLFAAFNSSIES
jgi:hypothetical protein